MSQQPQTQSNESLEDIFGPVIYAYTRAMALGDGYLIDISDTAREAGFKIPVAVTREVWDRYIEWDNDDSERQSYQDQSGRLWDVCWMARHGVSGTKKHESQTLFELYVIPRDGTATEAERTALKIVIGPGDEGEPVITIMLPHQD
jgi:hypothetical protein